MAAATTTAATAAVTEVVYTDGGCNANGAANATGGFGIYLLSSALFSAPVRINRKGERMIFASSGGFQEFSVTNIRMEGLAIVSALALYTHTLVTAPASPEVERKDVVAILNAANPFRTAGFKLEYQPSELDAWTAPKPPGCQVSVEIVTDSQFWINVVESWMPKWIRTNKIADKKNQDILLMFAHHMQVLKHNGVAIAFTHVRSHQQGARTAHADGNDIADELATAASTNATTLFVLN